MKQKVVIVDFGSQYTQLIGRRVRELNVFCEIVPFDRFDPEDGETAAVILSGSPFSVTGDTALKFDVRQVIGKWPVLGICYGAQMIAQQLGGEVAPSKHREYGLARLKLVGENDLFFNCSQDSRVWMSHGDSITVLPEQFHLLASTRSIPVAAFRSSTDSYPHAVYCLQFHPEVVHSEEGKQILSNFLFQVSGLEENWTPASFIESQIEYIREKVGDENVVMGLSGGVDSSVAATLIDRAIGDRLTCIFVDNGLLRKGEFEQVKQSYREIGLQLDGVDAKERFYEELAGVIDPEEKRKAIGKVFIDVFQEESQKLDNVKWLGQGTIYPDVIESQSVHGPSATIKSHHNVGGLPEIMHLKIIEPLRMLFKDEVRKVGEELGLPHSLTGRHPFPGPGLAIRIIGEVTPEKVALLQEADAIYIDALRENGWYDKVWQAGAILLPVQSVGVMGDERTYEQAIALRAVNSTDGMTAEWSRLPHDLLQDISSTIINNVKGINRVVYDISTKPPATIEWE